MFSSLYFPIHCKLFIRSVYLFYIACLLAASLQSCPTLCDPMDCSLPGFSVHGILQARTLEWVAISFSSAWKWKVKGKSLSHVWLLATPWTAAYQAPPSMGSSRQEYWRGVPLPSPCFILRNFNWKSHLGLDDKELWMVGLVMYLAYLSAPKFCLLPKIVGDEMIRHVRLNTVNDWETLKNFKQMWNLTVLIKYILMILLPPCAQNVVPALPAWGTEIQL